MRTEHRQAATSCGVATTEAESGVHPQATPGATAHGRPGVGEAPSPRPDTDVVVSPEVTRFVLRADLLTAHAIRAAADTGLLYALRPPGADIDSLSARGYDPAALDALLSLLRHLGIAEREEKRWRLSHLAHSLLDDRSVAALKASGWGTRIEEAGRSLGQSLVGGRTPYEREYGRGFWTDLAAHPSQETAFHDYLEHTTRAVAETLVENLDFSTDTRAVDVAGGRGALTRTLLSLCPHLEAVVVDLPSLARFFPDPEPAAASGRLRFQAGDIFDEPLPEGDVYLLSQVLHDWPDRSAIRILSNVRRSMPAGARLLVIDRMTATTSECQPVGEHAHMSMRVFVMFGARERSIDDFEQLAASAGLNLAGFTPLTRGFGALNFVLPA